jgi:hypothetical protein
MKRKPNPPVESTADFKQRLALMGRERDTGNKYAVVGAAPAHPCVVRRVRPRGQIKPGNGERSRCDRFCD